MPAIHQAGRTLLRDLVKAGVSHIGVATDQAPFDDGQSVLDPNNAGASDRLIKAASKADVDGNTVDIVISIDNDTASEFEGKTIWTIGAQAGGARTDNISRLVRSQGIGLQDGDLVEIGVRLRVADNTP